jgi:hypothetical protein
MPEAVGAVLQRPDGPTDDVVGDGERVPVLEEVFERELELDRGGFLQVEASAPPDADHPVTVDLLGVFEDQKLSKVFRQGLFEFP